MKPAISPHRISTEITSAKIKVINDIDLNALFNLSYNFDLLKGIIETLLSNQQLIQKQLDESYASGIDKDQKIEYLENEINKLKSTYVDKDTRKLDLEEINKHFKKNDDQINDSKQNKNIYFCYFF